MSTGKAVEDGAPRMSYLTTISSVVWWSMLRTPAINHMSTHDAIQRVMGNADLATLVVRSALHALPERFNLLVYQPLHLWVGYARLHH